MLKKLKKAHVYLIDGVFMNLLEKEILKYEKKGFKVAQRRTLKHGLRVYLKRKGEGWFPSDLKVYLYYVDGDYTTDNLRECFKDYVKFYENEEFGKGDKGFLLCSGSLDEKLFKDLRKAMVEDDDIRNSIKPTALGEGETVTRKRALVEEKLIKEKVTEREIRTRKIAIEHINFNSVVRLIESHPLVPQPKEKGYEAQLYSAFTSKGYPVEYEGQRRGSRFDLIIGDDEIAVELKIVKNASVFNSLVGQVMRYKRQFNKIIIVLIDQFKNPSIMKKEIESLKKIDPENIEVIVK
jgi:hypothetical protein